MRKKLAALALACIALAHPASAQQLLDCAGKLKATPAMIAGANALFTGDARVNKRVAYELQFLIFVTAHLALQCPSPDDVQKINQQIDALDRARNLNLPHVDSQDALAPPKEETP